MLPCAALLLLIAAGPAAGGRHLRIDAEQGPVHVWKPAGYDRSTAGIVIYVHGYLVNVDRAWSEYALAEQFAASRQNALFIVPEAPSKKDEPVFYPDLGALLALVEAETPYARPDGPLIVLGHSGAYRTIKEWLGYERIDQLILLDGLYAYEDEFSAFAEDPANRLVIITKLTTGHADTILKKLPRAARATSIFKLSRNKRAHRAIEINVGDSYDHMSLVTSKEVIPQLLKMTPLRKL